MPEESKSFLSLYTGMDEDYEEYLFLDLNIPNREINLWISPGSTDNCSPADLLKYLESALNEARLYMNNLGLRLRIDKEMIAEMSEDFSNQDRRNVHELLKEARL